MKKLICLVVILLIGAFAVSACKKAAESPAAGVAGKEATTETKSAAANEEISANLSKSLCKRMVECAPGTMTEEDCTTQTVTSLTEALKEKPLNITKDQLSTCIASIEKGTCEEVMGTEPPKGCEFLQ